jgi:DNA-binding NarL/FixJ family response regulator
MKPNPQLLMRPIEQQVLKMIVDGKRNKQIADRVNLSVSGVKWIRTKILKMYGVKLTVQMAVIYGKNIHNKYLEE